MAGTLFNHKPDQPVFPPAPRGARLARSLRRWRVPIILFAVYLTLVSCVGLRDMMLLHPSVDPIVADGAEKVQLARSDGGVTDAFIARSPACATQAPEAWVLNFTGNGTRAEWIAAEIAQRWQNHPVEVVTVNYPGYGGSTGPASLDKIPPMALDAFDAVKKRAGDHPVIVTGHSLGCTAALYVGAHRNVAGMMLQNPPPLRQLIIGHFGWWNLWLGALPIAYQIPSQLDAIACARDCRAPAVLITSLQDDYVPPRYHKMVIDAYAGPHSVVAFDGGHNTAPDAAPQFPGAIDWLWHQAGLPPAPPLTNAVEPPPHEMAG
jgi:predicted alpha/beta hydrolase family esterase